MQRNARRRQDELFSIQTRPNTVGCARLGMTVSRRVSTRAVDRNRIKRSIRESFRQRRNIFGAIDIVVVARPLARETETARLRESLELHWRSIQEQCRKS